MQKRKSDPEKVKELFFDLWKIFPNGFYREEKIEKIIVTQAVRDQLVNQGFLYKEAHKAEENEGNCTWYSLGGNGINLIIAWEIQKVLKESNKQAYTVNLVLTFLTIILIILTFVMLWKLFNPY